MAKIYGFILTNVIFMALIGTVLNLLGKADDTTVLIGVLLLITLPFMYVLNLMAIGYWKTVKGFFDDVLSD